MSDLTIILITSYVSIGLFMLFMMLIGFSSRNEPVWQKIVISVFWLPLLLIYLRIEDDLDDKDDKYKKKKGL